MGVDPLIEQARLAREAAHAPYSGFKVGAALESIDGSVTLGCNVENASFGLTICAERSAVCAAVVSGQRAFRRIVISTEAPEPVSPCGACRQVLAEFGVDLEVVSEASGGVTAWALSELLPDPFVLERPGSRPEVGP